MRKRQQRGQAKNTCSKCKGELEPNRKGKYRYCRSCHAAHMRENRKKYCEFSEEEKKRANARSIVNVAIRRGSIVRQPCEVCGEIRSEAHHDDYDRPYEIKWLCKKHHIIYHKSKDKV
jgi:hypothetical protein